VTSGGRGQSYTASAARALIAACVLYAFVNVLYSLARFAGIYAGLAIAGGTGILLGLIMEWLRRRRI
jgi:ABC-type nitrate/sulfonate/bicarbonate transport system permease component